MQLKRIVLLAFLIFIGFVQVTPLSAQKKKLTKEERRTIMKDTLDGKFDFSRLIVDVKGFIPMVMIITEPALGGFGGMLLPVFITPKKNTGVKGYVPPDITAGALMYTVNGSWMSGVFRMGIVPKAGIKYRAGLAYADINLDFYKDIPNMGEQKFNFELEALPVFVSLSKKVSKSDIYLGLEYMFSYTKVKPNFQEEIPSYITDKELDSRTGALGVFADWDKRNSIFTPDKGARLNVLYSVNDNWTGSSFEYQRFNTSLNWFVPLRSNWISGVRAEVQQIFKDPPFYAVPSINLRGIPFARYQGYITALVETEQRYDFTPRWSAVAFAGMGKAMAKDQSFSDADLVYNYGTGFRYLLARAFNLRAGIDIAKGPDSFGWYIIFGHNWNR